MKNEKVLQIVRNNKLYFETDEKVSLNVETKNIPTLEIKVYEITTENYYRKHKKELQSNINLDGLVASYNQTADFKDPPIVKKVR